jgi:hypothetical protein
MPTRNISPPNCTHECRYRLRNILTPYQQRIIRQIHPKIRIELRIVHPTEIIYPVIALSSILGTRWR